MAQHDDKRARRRPRAEAGEAWSWRAEGGVAAAEALGAALLVLLSCLAGGAAGGAGAGAVVAALVQCFDHVSGAMFNPTVTLAALLWGRVGARRAACVLAAQLAGAAAGAAALRALAPGADGVTAPAPALGALRGAALEAAGGACLALANCASWDARNAAHRDSWPLRIGACVAALTYALGPRTGASVNPARSFGPALVQGRWEHHWVYWAGPLAGSLGATSLYCALWRPPPAPLAPPLA